MTQYDNNMSGIISRNERKETDKHPDIKGQCEIDGVQYWIDGWSKTRNSDGGKFYSLKFKPKQQAAAPAKASPAPAKAAPSGFDDLDDGSDIPFVSASPMFDMVPRKLRKMARYDY